MANDPRIDAYIAAGAPFARPILDWLRARVHIALPDVGETIKWGMPFFTLGDRPFANMAAFKAHASFGFWQREGTQTGREGKAMGQFGRIASIDDLPDAAAFEDIVRDAAARIAENQPRRAPRPPKPPFSLHPALRAALDASPDAAAQFTAFPQSTQRDYADWIADAKTDATRDRRIADAVAWIGEGKRRNWKYENC